jgi:ATP-dependent exoDNAse (exonuclease V) beta subunit
MTIHAAKGLEFPITIVSGMSTEPQTRAAAADVAFPPGGTVGYRFGRHVETEEFAAWKPIDEQMGFDERIRLLYVATTRAKDHLVVSLHRRTRAAEPKPTARTNAELLVDGMDSLLDGLPDALDPAVASVPVPVVPPPPPIEPLSSWRASLSAALTAASRPSVIAATALTDEAAHDPEGELAAGLSKRPRDMDLPPWLKGRYGTAVGRAVHGTLQTIDLATGAGLAAAVAAQCEAEAIPDRNADVTRLVQHALASEVVQEAARSPHWREIYACAPVGDRLLGGYIDLLYRSPDGLVIVDYKTSATADPEELDRRVEGYRLQGEAYGRCITETTGEPAARVVFLFLTASGAVARELDVHAPSA